MEIKPLSKTPNLPTSTDKPTYNQVLDIITRVNQLVKKANTPVSTDVPAHKANHATGGSDALNPIDIGAAATTHKSNHAIGGSDVLTPADIGAQPANTPLPGSVVQVVNYETGSVATGTTTIPLDDTIPQNTEGDQYMTLSITPKSASNHLKIDIVFIGSSSISSGNYLTAALFKDTDVNALAAANAVAPGQTYIRTITFTHFMTAGTISPISFKVRAGTSVAGTTTFNGYSSGRLLGGVMASSITVTEVQA